VRVKEFVFQFSNACELEPELRLHAGTRDR